MCRLSATAACVSACNRTSTSCAHACGLERERGNRKRKSMCRGLLWSKDAGCMCCTTRARAREEGERDFDCVVDVIQGIASTKSRFEFLT
jgi:hypothetical protein